MVQVGFLLYVTRSSTFPIPLPFPIPFPLPYSPSHSGRNVLCSSLESFRRLSVGTREDRPSWVGYSPLVRPLNDREIPATLCLVSEDAGRPVLTLHGGEKAKPFLHLRRRHLLVVRKDGPGDLLGRVDHPALVVGLSEQASEQIPRLDGHLRHRIAGEE